MARVVSTLVQVHVAQPSELGWRHLIVRRLPTDETLPSMWQCITGHILPGEGAYHAAQRELAEETGLQAAEWWALPTIGSFYDPTSDAIVIVPAFGAVVTPHCSVQLSEHAEYCWGSAHAVSSKLSVPAQREGVLQFEKLLIMQEHVPHIRALYRLNPLSG
ncbi:MAG: NUDIX domain-containing protein [Bacteroidota bacterium]|nr:NUDIX domain-containing protein [Candidatus Kapabacteria bacterium]MCS7301847.1 NUDIX domain-containing protein [Candidatus Kapabacteria bacterium]MDW8271645.1 NUDIX domain-containing protein [Bacteroidota bacterium]